MSYTNHEIILLIAILYFVFLTRHLIGDYILQTEYMLGKFNECGWVVPLAMHCSVIAIGTFIILLITGIGVKYALILSIIDFVLHFCIDRLKAAPNILKKYTYTDKMFWVYIGVDQYLHHITDLLLVMITVMLMTAIV